MKSKFIIAGILALFLCSCVSSHNYYQNDKMFREALLKNNVVKSKWAMILREEIPVELMPYITSSHSNGPETKYLLPLIVMDFNPNGSFEYIWKKTSDKVGTIEGKWEIKNGQLILSLSQNYTEPYIKGVQFRYNIKGTVNDKFPLALEGTQYPSVTGTLKTSNNLMEDMKKIALSGEHAEIIKPVPEATVKTEEKTPPAFIETVQKAKPEAPAGIETQPEGNGPIKIQMSESDTFTLTEPVGWDIDLMQYKPLVSADVLITPETGNDFNLILGFKGVKSDLSAYSTPEKMKAKIEKATEKYLPYIDKKVSIEPLPFDKNGFYTILTDKTLANKKKIPRRKFKHLVKGIYKPSDHAVLEFTLMISQIDSEKYNNLLKYIFELQATDNQ